MAKNWWAPSSKPPILRVFNISTNTDDKQRELTIALADLLLNAAAEPAEPDSREDA
jgi:hypothetical protein